MQSSRAGGESIFRATSGNFAGIDADRVRGHARRQLARFFDTFFLKYVFW